MQSCDLKGKSSVKYYQIKSKTAFSIKRAWLLSVVMHLGLSAYI